MGPKAVLILYFLFRICRYVTFYHSSPFKRELLQSISKINAIFWNEAVNVFEFTQHLYNQLFILNKIAVDEIRN